MKANRTYNPCDDCPHSYSKTGEESSACKICEFKYLLDNQPKQGKWIEHIEKPDWLEDDVNVYYTCSCCETNNFCESPYCPNCGAKMNKEN